MDSHSRLDAETTPETAPETAPETEATPPPKSARPVRRQKKEVARPRPAEQCQTVFLTPDVPISRDQLRALNVVRGKSRVESEAAMKSGSSVIAAAFIPRKNRSKVDADLIDRNNVAPTVTPQILQDIVADAPIVIHITAAVLDLISGEAAAAGADGVHAAKYRSIFETNTGRGCLNKETRKGWERKCFAGLYDIADDAKRPKYGAMNFLRRADGVAPATHYGECFLELSRDVNKRCTIAPHDTSVCNIDDMGVPDYCFHVISKFAAEELRGLCDLAAGGKTTARYSGGYREIQIHGDVIISRDVVRVHYPRVPAGTVSGSPCGPVTATSQISAERFAATFGIPAVGFLRR